MESNEKKSTDTGNGGSSYVLPVTVGIICLTVLLLAGGAAYLFTDLKKDGKKSLSEAIQAIQEKNKLGVLIGQTLRENNVLRLQFKERDLVLFFQLARWRGGKYFAEEFKRTGTPKVVMPDVTLGQYTLAEGRGVYQVVFYIDLKHQERWDYRWDREKKTLTVIAPAFKPPNVGCNEPGAISSPEVTVKVDCVTFYEPQTKKMLESEIPFLKKRAALHELKFQRENARKQIEKFFAGLIPQMLNAQKNDINVIVRFRDDEKIDKGAL